MTTPPMARVITTPFCWAKSLTLMCKAPANSRELNMPCVSFDKAWGAEAPNTFGTDEFVAWCRLTGLEP